MGRAKEQYMEMQEVWINQRLASTLGITFDELEELQWEIHEDRSKDGMLYNYRIEFYDNCPVDILNKIDNLEDGTTVYLSPSEFDDGIEEGELEWDIISSNQLKILQSHLSSARILLNNEYEKEIEFNVFVMLYAHIVATMEHYLSSTFIHIVTNSAELTRKLIETDPEFGNRKFTLNKIYLKQEELKVTVASYLKSLIFHDIKKVKPMYKQVIGFDFNDVSWLFKAVMLRHDCAHRAGFDKEGEKINITNESIEKLILQCEKLAESIDIHVIETYEKTNNT